MRWWVLVVLGTAQLMVTLDATVVNIALPAAQHDLGFSDGSRQWVITGYALGSPRWWPTSTERTPPARLSRVRQPGMPVAPQPTPETDRFSFRPIRVNLAV